MTREQMRQQVVDGIDRTLSNAFIRNHMTDEEVRTARAMRDFWDSLGQVTSDALDTLVNIYASTNA